VHGGAKRIPAEIAADLAQHYTDDVLTERELEVPREVAGGNANKMVADHLGISEETVKAHRRSILSKLGANDRTHAVTFAPKRGIIEIGTTAFAARPSLRASASSRNFHVLERAIPFPGAAESLANMRREGLVLPIARMNFVWGGGNMVLDKRS